ncbi:MAG: hypothetical protein JNJ96_10995, partial [Anaerolineales bacterium]|nr:hypothetical protein [Anaerolineales bacterium]
MTSTEIKTNMFKFPILGTILIRLGWLAVVIPSIVYSVNGSFQQLSADQAEIEKWVYIYLNFGSFVVGALAAVIIFWRKPTDRLAVIVSLMLVTWTSTSTGFDLWFSMNLSGDETINWFIAYFLGTGYTLLLSTLLLYVLLTFPNGKWTPGWARWFFTLSLLGMLILPVYLCVMIFLASGLSDEIRSFLLDTLPELFRLGVLGLGVLA